MRMSHQISGNKTQDMIRKQYILCIIKWNKLGQDEIKTTNASGQRSNTLQVEAKK